MSNYFVSTSNGIDLYHKENFCYSEAYSFVLRYYADAIEENSAFSITPWNNDTCGIFYAKVENKIIGAIVYDTDFNERNENRVLEITFAAVAPEFRKQKVYTMLHRNLESWGKLTGFSTLLTLVYKDNNAFINCSKKMGLNHITYRTIKYLNK